MKLIKLLSPILFAFTLLIISSRAAQAAVVINEFSSTTSEDWVELYNTATDSADLSEYRLRDSTDTNSKDVPGTIAGGGFSVISFSNYLNIDGDTVRLVNKNDNSTVDSVSYGSGKTVCAASGSQTIGRSSDGGGSFTLFSTGSKGSTNNGTQTTSCPAPTPTPVATPNPTATPKPTLSPTTTPKPVLASPKVSPKSSPKASADESPQPSTESEVLGQSQSESSPSPASSSSAGLKNNSTAIGIAMIVGGLTISSVGGFFLYKQALKNSGEDQNLV